MCAAVLFGGEGEEEMGVLLFGQLDGDEAYEVVEGEVSGHEDQDDEDQNDKRSSR